MTEDTNISSTFPVSALVQSSWIQNVHFSVETITLFTNHGWVINEPFNGHPRISKDDSVSTTEGLPPVDFRRSSIDREGFIDKVLKQR